MKKNNLFILLLSFIIFIPFSVGATNQYSDVYFGTNINACTKLQDNSLGISGVGYFSQCMKATCSNKTYDIKAYDSSKSVVCRNGNKNPYWEVVKDGCNTGYGNFYNTKCSSGTINYCTKITKYDCSKKSDGSSFTTTTKSTTTKTKTTKSTTTKTTNTTTTTTTVPVVISTKLKSLSLSNGYIMFNADVYSYSLTINESVSNIDVNAIAEDSNATVNISGNTNLVNGSVISIVVSDNNGNSSEYKINIIKEVKLSNNANLISLSVSEYDIKFVSDTKEYSVILDNEIKYLTINYEVEDVNASVNIVGNSNLVDGSKVNIVVTAEDGTINTYSIFVNFKEQSNFLTILFIIILILAMGAGGYYVYKKFFNVKKEDKYEYE